MQIGLLVNRIPQYATLLQGWAREVLTHLQENFGPDVVNDKLRDLVSGQAGIDAEHPAVDRHRLDRQRLRHLQPAVAGSGDPRGGLLSAAGLAEGDADDQFLAALPLPQTLSARRRARSIAFCQPGCAARRCAACFSPCITLPA